MAIGYVNEVLRTLWFLAALRHYKNIADITIFQVNKMLYLNSFTVSAAKKNILQFQWYKKQYKTRLHNYPSWTFIDLQK